MSNTPIGMMLLPLGRGTAQEYGLTAKAAMLDTAAERGVPVPEGVILLDEARRAAVREVLVNTNDARLIQFLTLNEGLARLISARAKVAVRASFGQPLTTTYPPQLNIDPGDVTGLADAIRAVWNAGASLPQEARRDVLIMRMVNPVRTGTAYSESDYEDDLVLFGEQRRTMTKLRRWEEADQPENWLSRLQIVLRDLRRIFGAKSWEVHFADDGTTCWLLEIDAITDAATGTTSHAPVREDLFVPAEADHLPRNPGKLTASILETVAPKLSSVFQTADRAAVARRPLMRVVNGAPQFNLSLMVDLMRSWGLATEGIAKIYGGEAARNARGFKSNLARAVSRPTVLANLSVNTVFAPNRAQEAYREMLDRTEPNRIGNTFKAVTETAQEVYETFYSALLTMNAAVAAREATQSSARPTSGGLSVEMLADLEPLHTQAIKSKEIYDTLSENKLPTQPEFTSVWRSFITKHGHRAPMEDDLASPRFYEDPRSIYQAILTSNARPGELGKLTQARENLRYQAMYAIERLRNKFLNLADQAVARGSLSERNEVWTKTTAELIALDQAVPVS